MQMLAEALHDHGDKNDLMESRAAFAEKRKPNFKGWKDPEDRHRLPTPAKRPGEIPLISLGAAHSSARGPSEDPTYGDSTLQETLLTKMSLGGPEKTSPTRLPPATGAIRT